MHNVCDVKNAAVFVCVTCAMCVMCRMWQCLCVCVGQELRLGCVHEGQVWEGPAIPLSGDEVEQHLYSPHLGKVLYLDGQVQLQLLLPPQTAGGLTQVIAASL